MDDHVFRPSRHRREILLADWRDAEELAAWHMRTALGIEDAVLTGAGADGGIDVRSAEAVAQVKHYATPVGGPEVQQAVGAGHGSGRVLFYSLGGYTAQALAYAQRAGVALFKYNVYADVTPVTDAAREIEQDRRSGGDGSVKAWSKAEQRRAEAAAALRRYDDELAGHQRDVDRLVASLRAQTDLHEDIEAIGFLLAECATFLPPERSEAADLVREYGAHARAGTRDFLGRQVSLDRIQEVEQELTRHMADVQHTMASGLPSLPDWVAKLHEWDQREQHLRSWAYASSYDVIEPSPEQVKIRIAEECLGQRYRSIAERFGEDGLRHHELRGKSVAWVIIHDPLRVGEDTARTALAAFVSRRRISLVDR